MSATLYIETSIIGYLTARSSNNLILMANVDAQIQKKLVKISLDAGYELPTICTPYELMGE
jgi:hypothetical protein